MKNLLIIFLLLLLIACKENTNNMKIIVYNSAQSEQIKLSKEDYQIVYSKLTNLFTNSSEVLRLFVQPSLIEKLKESANLIEFSFVDETKFNSKILGEELLNTILIPLSGDFIGNEKDPIITLFMSYSGEYSEPFRNKNGYSELLEIKRILDKY